MIIAVASGKGGTGKTTVAVSLARLLSRDSSVRFIDCDVEAPNAHISLKPVLTQKQEVSLPIPEVDPEICTLCGRCAEVCQYHAIAVVGEKVLVFPEICHGCGSCTINCPVEAIHEISHPLGLIEAGQTAEGIAFHRGLLDIGQPLAVPIIHQLKRWQTGKQAEFTLIDSPPGTSCPVVESIKGADYVILVTEPTPFGLHDLALAAEVTRLLGLKAGVIINRDGIGDNSVEEFCEQQGLPILMRIPLDREIAAGLASGKALIEIRPDYEESFSMVLEEIIRTMETEV